jgi:signal transduction histidine kinase
MDTQILFMLGRRTSDRETILNQIISPANSRPEEADIFKPGAQALGQACKMEVMEHMATGLAHDFNNMLHGVVGALDMMQSRIGQGRADDIADLVQVALTSLRRTAALTHSLIAFWRPQPVEVNLVSVNAVIESMESLLRCTLGDEIQVQLALTGELPSVACDQHQLENALLNMVVNARDAMPHGGELVVTTSWVDQAPEEAGEMRRRFLVISVADTGFGMAPDVAERAFDLFYSTKRASRGTGLGLAMVKCFVDRLAGQVRIRSVVGEGTTITLYLPTR